MENKVYYIKENNGITFRIPCFIDKDWIYYTSIYIDNNLKVETHNLSTLDKEFETLIATSQIISKYTYNKIEKELDKTNIITKTLNNNFKDYLNKLLNEKED